MKAMKFLLGAFVVLMALGGIAMAGDTTSVTATVQAGVEVSAPSTGSVTFNLGTNTAVPMNTPVNVQSSATGWYLKGYSGATKFTGLTNYYKLSVAHKDTAYYGTVDLNGGSVYANSGLNLAQGVASGAFDIPILFDQDIVVTDPVGSSATDSIQFSVQTA